MRIHPESYPRSTRGRTGGARRGPRPARLPQPRGAARRDPLSVGADLITGGRLGDLYGRRRVFPFGLAAFMLASAGCGLAPTPGALIGMRVAQGLAGGLMIPQVFAIMRASFEPGARAKALGAYGAVLGLASLAGPLLGGLLVEADLFGLGWRDLLGQRADRDHRPVRGGPIHA